MVFHEQLYQLYLYLYHWLARIRHCEVISLRFVVAKRYIEQQKCLVVSWCQAGIKETEISAALLEELYYTTPSAAR